MTAVAVSTHVMANLMTKVPRSAQTMVATLVCTIFDQPDATQVWAQHARVVEQLSERFPDSANMLIDAGPDLLAFTAFPHEHWRRIRSNNPQERLNREMRRRTEVVGIFPNHAAVIRLMGAVLAEQQTSGPWPGTKCPPSLAKARLRVVPGGADQPRAGVLEVAASA
jgi:transposase-like protein